jgi:SAM-dependent methyltransferase
MPQVSAEVEEGDAFGRALLDRLGGGAGGAGGGGAIVCERDDGFVDADGSDYLSGWDRRDAWAADRSVGRVLDVGAGAGRASLALQDRGQQVVALDVSPGAVEACRRRGVREVFPGGVADLARSGPEPFDSALLLGNNLGLLAAPDQAGRFLQALGAVLGPAGVIVGTCLDPHQTSEETHLAYHRRNRERGRMPGQITMRIRYQRLATAWFGLLWMSPDELTGLVSRHGWQVAEVLPGALYGVTLTRR